MPLPVLLQTVNTVDGAGNALELTAQVVSGWHREGVTRIDDEVDSRVTGSRESPALPFDVPELAIVRNRQSQNAGLVRLCLEGPSACITHLREMLVDQS